MMSSAPVASLHRCRALPLEVHAASRPRRLRVLPGTLLPPVHQQCLLPSQLQIDPELLQRFFLCARRVLQPAQELSQAVPVGDYVDRAPLERGIGILLRNDVYGAEEREKARSPAHAVAVLVDETDVGVKWDTVGEGAGSPFRRRACTKAFVSKSSRQSGRVDLDEECTYLAQ